MNSKFLSGILVYSAINSLYQDMIGKEAFLERVNNNWYPAYITVPLAIIILIAALVLYFKKSETNQG